MQDMPASAAVISVLNWVLSVFISKIDIHTIVGSIPRSPRVIPRPRVHRLQKMWRARKVPPLIQYNIIGTYLPHAIVRLWNSRASLSRPPGNCQLGSDRASALFSLSYIRDGMFCFLNDFFRNAAVVALVTVWSVISPWTYRRAQNNLKNRNAVCHFPPKIQQCCHNL